VAFSEFEQARITKLVRTFIERRRPPPHIRPQLDLDFRIERQSVEIFEVRPRWKGAPGETMEHPVAKATYQRVRDEWKVYWQRADLKWHGYQPVPLVSNIEEFLRLVDEDAYAAFFG
jgi:hypothetical protein